MKPIKIAFLLLFFLFIAVGLVLFGKDSELPSEVEITPTPTATPSATLTPTPQIIFRNVPASPTSGQSAQPSSAPAQNGQPQTINNNTTIQQQPQPTPPPAPEPTPGLIRGILDGIL